MLEPPHRYLRSVIPHVFVRGAADAIAFYSGVFGATEIVRVATPDGLILHAEIKVYDSILMIGDPVAGFSAPASEAAPTFGLHVYVSDVDEAFSTAVAAGARALAEPRDMFYGDRMAMLADPFDLVWVFLEHRVDLAIEEIRRRGEALLALGPSIDATAAPVANRR